MRYLVRLTSRALRDMEAIYYAIEAGASGQAFAWFNALADAVLSFERFPNRSPFIPENKRLRHLFFGNKPHIYRIIYAVDQRKKIVNVLHIRHGASAPVSTE